MAEQAKSLKVFVSYSRADVAFADQLVLVLEDKGFEPILDRHDISGAENWRERLGKLILSADAVTFVLTARSAVSEICAWEVGEAQRLGKRIIPVTPESISGVKPPAALGELNWIPFHADAALPGSGFYYGVKRLAEALSIDLDWLRAQTRYSERALEWVKERPEDLLLRGEALKEAEAWQARTPAGAHPPDLVREYLAASGDAEQHRQVAAKAQLEEREQALRTAEAAVADSRRAQQALRRFSIWALIAGVILLAIAIPGNYFAATRTLDANDRKAALFADTANGLTRQGDYTRGLLMALAGDPPARVGLLEDLMRPNGNVTVRNALARAYASDRAVASMDVEDAVGLATLEDGVRFITVHTSGKVLLWTAGERLAPQTLPLTKPVTNVFPLPDGDRIVVEWKPAVGQPFGVWSLSQGKLLREFGPSLTADPMAWPQAVALSFEGDWLAVGDRGKVSIWDTGTGAEIKSTTLDPMGFDAIAASSDADLVTLSAGERVVSWSPMSDKRVGPEESVIGSVRALSYYQASDTLLFGSDGGNFGLVDDSKARLVPLLQTFADDVVNVEAITRLRPARDERGILMISGGGQVKLFDIKSKKLTEPFGRRSDVIDAGFLPKAGMLVALSGEGAVMLASYGRAGERGSLGSMLGLPEDGSLSSDEAVSMLSRDGTLASVLPDGSLHVWQPGMEAAVSFKPPPETINQLADAGFLFSAPASLLATSDGRKVDVWSVGSQTPKTLLKAATDADSIVDGRFVLDGRAIFYRLSSGVAGVRMIDTGEDVFPPRKMKSDTIMPSPDGKQIAELEGYTRVRIHNASSSTPFEFVSKNAVRGLSFSSDGRVLGVMQDGGAFELWRPGESRAFQLGVAHGGEILNMAFQKGGDLFATVGQDTRVVLWRLGERDPVQAFEMPVDATTDSDGDDVIIQFSQDGRYLVTATKRGVLRFEINPIVFADVDTQVKMACARIAERGISGFSNRDYADYTFMQKVPQNPCVALGLAKVVAR